MNTEFDTLSPARRAYIERQASKKGLTVEAFITRNHVPVRQYPFTQQEDATMRLEPQHRATQEMIDLYDAHRSDYGDDKMKDNFYAVGEEITNYQLVKIGEHTVGFIMTLSCANSNGEFQVLENVYVKPEFRGWGVATRIYRLAIAAGITGITLAWDRIASANQQEFWSKIGYRTIHLMAGQASAADSLVFLTTHTQRTSPVQWPLSEAALARFHCRKINTLIHQKLGFSPARAEYDKYLEVINEITINYLRKKKLISPVGCKE